MKEVFIPRQAAPRLSVRHELPLKRILYFQNDIFDLENPYELLFFVKFENGPRAKNLSFSSMVILVKEVSVTLHSCSHAHNVVSKKAFWKLAKSPITSRPTLLDYGRLLVPQRLMWRLAGGQCVRRQLHLHTHATGDISGGSGHHCQRVRGQRSRSSNSPHSAPQ